MEADPGTQIFAGHDASSQSIPARSRSICRSVLFRFEQGVVNSPDVRKCFGGTGCGLRSKNNDKNYGNEKLNRNISSYEAIACRSVWIPMLSAQNVFHPRTLRHSATIPTRWYFIVVHFFRDKETQSEDTEYAQLVRQTDMQEDSYDRESGSGSRFCTTVRYV